MSEKNRDKIASVIILLLFVMMVFQPYRILTKSSYNIKMFLASLVIAIWCFGTLYLEQKDKIKYKREDKKLSKKLNLKTARKEEVIAVLKKAIKHKLSTTNLYDERLRYSDNDTYNLILKDNEIPIYANIKGGRKDYRVEVFMKYVDNKLTIMNPEVVENPDKYKTFCGSIPANSCRGIVIVDSNTLEMKKEQQERYENWIDEWNKSSAETERWREEQRKKQQEQEELMRQRDYEERERLDQLYEYAYAAYSDESEREGYLRENGYYDF